MPLTTDDQKQVKIYYSVFIYHLHLIGKQNDRVKRLESALPSLQSPKSEQPWWGQECRTCPDFPTQVAESPHLSHRQLPPRMHERDMGLGALISVPSTSSSILDAGITHGGLAHCTTLFAQESFRFLNSLCM